MVNSLLNAPTKCLIYKTIIPVLKIIYKFSGETDAY